MSISKEAIEAAARAIYDVRDDPYDDDEWEEMDSADREECICLARAALTAAAPYIQAAAWDAVIARIDLGTPYMVDAKYVAGANWVRNQIEDVLKPTIEGETK